MEKPVTPEIVIKRYRNNLCCKDFYSNHNNSFCKNVMTHTEYIPILKKKTIQKRMFHNASEKAKEIRMTAAIQ